jgi:drug/metabolite transporter (DMT)-like permease
MSNLSLVPITLKRMDLLVGATTTNRSLASASRSLTGSGSGKPSTAQSLHQLTAGLPHPQIIAAFLALCAAATFASAAVIQHKVAAQHAQGTPVKVGILFKLFKSPLWLAGLALLILNFCFEASALAIGGLLVVEPLFSCSLIFALIFGAHSSEESLRPWEWVAAGMTVMGILGFLELGQPTGGGHLASTGSLLAAAGIAAGVILVAMVVARFFTHLRASVLGCMTGMSAGILDTTTKSGAWLLGTLGLAAFGHLRLWLMLPVGFVTITLLQNAYRAGRLASVLPGSVVFEPVVGSTIGLWLYHEHLSSGPLDHVGQALAALLALVGVALLARSPHVTQVLQQPADGTAPPLATGECS